MGHHINEKINKQRIWKVKGVAPDRRESEVVEGRGGGFFFLGRLPKKSFFDLENPAYGKK